MAREVFWSKKKTKIDPNHIAKAIFLGIAR